MAMREERGGCLQNVTVALAVVRDTTCRFIEQLAESWRFCCFHPEWWPK
jgi:hypothetical protein